MFIVINVKNICFGNPKPHSRSLKEPFLQVWTCPFGQTSVLVNSWVCLSICRSIFVNMFASRRLAHASPRKLAGTWTIGFTIKAPESTATADKVSALVASSSVMNTELEKRLLAAGVDAAAVSSMTTAAFQAATNATAGV